MLEKTSDEYIIFSRCQIAPWNISYNEKNNTNFWDKKEAEEEVAKLILTNERLHVIKKVEKFHEGKNYWILDTDKWEIISCYPGIALLEEKVKELEKDKRPFIIGKEISYKIKKIKVELEDK